jgi:hypothetical protein
MSCDLYAGQRVVCVRAGDTSDDPASVESDQKIPRIAG